MREKPIEDRGLGRLGFLDDLLGFLLAGGLGLRLGSLAPLLLLLTTLDLGLGSLLVLLLEALALLFLGTYLLLGGGVLPFVLLGLLGALLQLWPKFLANLVDIGIDKRGRMILDGDLHLLESLDELLGGHPELFGELMYTHSCHIPYHLSPADAALEVRMYASKSALSRS